MTDAVAESGAEPARDAPAILYSDEHLVAIAKPPGLAAHRSQLVAVDDDYLVDAVRRVTGRSLYLIHRLDRATSGVVLFGASREVAATLGAQFMSREVEKCYLAVCRGWVEAEGSIEYPLDAPGKPERKAALTRYRRLATVEWDMPLGRYPQQRYSLVEVRPETGRYRQIRRHFHHLSHHLIGDTSEGRGDHNRLFRQHLGVHRMFLHAWRIGLRHPVDGHALRITAPLDDEWRRVIERFGWGEAMAAAEAS